MKLPRNCNSVCSLLDIIKKLNCAVCFKLLDDTEVRIVYGPPLIADDSKKGFHLIFTSSFMEDSINQAFFLKYNETRFMLEGFHIIWDTVDVEYCDNSPSVELSKLMSTTSFHIKQEFYKSFE